MKAILIFACICILAAICGCVGVKDHTSAKEKASAATLVAANHVISLRHPHHPNNSSAFQWSLDPDQHNNPNDKDAFRLGVGPNRTVGWEMKKDGPDFAILILDTNNWAAPAGGWRTDILPPFNCSTCGGVTSTAGSVTLTFKGPAYTHYEIVVPGSIFSTRTRDNTATTQTNDMVDATIIYDVTDTFRKHGQD